MRLDGRSRRFLRTAWRSLRSVRGPAAPVWWMGLLAVVAGICLLAGVAICRKTPDTEPQILLAVPVLLLARLIFAYRLYSVDPVLANYYLELLGLMLLILASYRLSGFAVQAGGPRMFGFYADLTAILAVTLLADGHSAALLPLGGAAALDGFQRAMRMSDIAEKKTEEKKVHGPDGFPSGPCFCGRHTKRPSFDGLFVYDWEDWMKRSFVSCKY